MPSDAIEQIENIPLRNGADFDLVNISLLGVDPITGRSFDQCTEEWQAALARVQERANRLRWWDIVGRFRLARQVAILQQRQGMRGFTL